MELGARNTNDAGSSDKELTEIYSIYMVTSAKKYNQVGVEYLNRVNVRHKWYNPVSVEYIYNASPYGYKINVYFSGYIKRIRKHSLSFIGRSLRSDT